VDEELDDVEDAYSEVDFALVQHVSQAVEDVLTDFILPPDDENEGELPTTEET